MNIIRFPDYTSALTRVSEFDWVTSNMQRFKFICMFVFHLYLKRNGKLVPSYATHFAK